MSKVGFIGLGIMGAPMAANLLAGSHELFLYRMVKRTFDPGFRIERHQRDLNLALSAARQIGLSLPNTATAQELFNACVAHGGAHWDHSAMVRALEILGNWEIEAAKTP